MRVSGQRHGAGKLKEGGFEDRLLGDDNRTCWWIRCGRKGEWEPRVEPSFLVLVTMRMERG